MDETNIQDTSSRAPPLETDGMPVEAVNEEEYSPIANDSKSEETPAAAAQTTESSKTFKNLTEQALNFLSHASNETLGACLAGAGAATYLVLGRVGLVMIGVAGGVVLQATWDGIRGDDRDEATKQAERERRREAGIEVTKRLLDWRSSNTNADEITGDVKVYANRPLDFSAFEPETASALNAFTDAVIKDYVHYWYGPQIPGEESFPDSCRRTLTAFILSLSGHLQRKRPADAFLDFVTNASSIVIVFLNELAAATNASPHASPEDAIKAYLELKPDSSLSYVLDQKSQDEKLGTIAEDILQAYLDPKSYNCPPVHAFLKQVLAQLVLGSTVTLCSRPDWINEWIVYGLEESETTKEVMDIVDAGVEGRAPDKATESNDSQVTEAPREHIASKKEGTNESARPIGEHKREPSRAEEAMDEAMREAQRLTQLMMEEDERRAREERETSGGVGSSENVSEVTTQGAPTPTSSQSDPERQEEESASWTSNSQAPSIAESQMPSSQDQSATQDTNQPFTSFDQMVPNTQPTALTDGSSDNVAAAARQAPSQLTLHKAGISIFDDSVPGEKASIKAKPTIDYLIQIEPASSAFPGWMIARKYPDFEALHEILRRISVITGVVGFSESNPELPKWKAHSKSSLRTELERYLANAVQYQPLAESEGMKRFLAKDQGLSKSPSGKGGSFGWPTPDAFGKMGGDMMNVLTKAPKQVSGGGKVVFDGVTGGGKAVFGGVAGLVGGVVGGSGKKQTNPAPSAEGRQSRSSLATEAYSTGNNSRQSQDSLSAAASSRPTLDRHLSAGSTASLDLKSRPVASPQRSSFEVPSSESTSGTNLTSPPATPSSHAKPSLSASREAEEQQTIDLPPPPSEMPEDYGSPKRAAGARSSVETFRSTNTLDQRLSESVESTSQAPSHTKQKPKPALSESEASVAVELIFAVITELYTLSSAWNIRRTLLAAAKSYLLRPGNPQLLNIKGLLQSSLLDANLSDAGMAGHISKLRENALPTTEEMEVWKRDYPEKNDEQKEELRIKARKLLVSKGMPTALQSVMGAAASGEALGKVFDCLQAPEVSRGLVFGLMLQALRVVTH